MRDAGGRGVGDADVQSPRGAGEQDVRGTRDTDDYHNGYRGYYCGLQLPFRSRFGLTLYYTLHLNRTNQVILED